MTDQAQESNLAHERADRPKRRHEERAEKAVGWWRALQPKDLATGGKSAGDRATLAKLRRHSNPLELVSEPATGDLFRALHFRAPSPQQHDRGGVTDYERAAVLAGVLAHVKPPSISGSFASAMKGHGDRAVVSAIRMKRFMAAREPEDVLRQFQRILAMLGDKANVYDVAENVLAWLDDTPAGDRARTRFAFKYHGTVLEDADDRDAETAAPTDPQTKA
jgi:CRISPR type I-E-associated protein CasB/Cse2